MAQGPTEKIPLGFDPLAMLKDFRGATRDINKEIKTVERNIQRTVKAGRQVSPELIQQFDSLQRKRAEYDVILRQQKQIKESANDVKLLQAITHLRIVKDAIRGKLDYTDLGYLLAQPQVIRTVEKTLKRFGGERGRGVAGSLGKLARALLLIGLIPEISQTVEEDREAAKRVTRDAMIDLLDKGLDANWLSGMPDQETSKLKNQKGLNNILGVIQLSSLWGASIDKRLAERQAELAKEYELMVSRYEDIHGHIPGMEGKSEYDKQKEIEFQVAHMNEKERKGFLFKAKHFENEEYVRKKQAQMDELRKTPLDRFREDENKRFEDIQFQLKRQILPAHITD